MHARLIIPGLWLFFVISWFMAGSWSNQTVKRPNLSAEIPYRILLGLGVVCLFLPGRGRLIPAHRLWFITRFEFALIVLAMLAGFGFCWWARLHLGKFWSGMVTLKADHRLIDTGPYAIVRHPIYTGLILAFIATAAAKATLLGWAGTFLAILSFWIKARLEERWLSQELGTEVYDGYRRRVPMLLPFGPSVRSGAKG